MRYPAARLLKPCVVVTVEVMLLRLACLVVKVNPSHHNHAARSSRAPVYCESHGSQGTASNL